jgi:glycine oxidase
MPLTSPRSGPRVAVVGAGVIGRFIAYELALRGVAVELFDPGPDPSATTAASLGVLTHFNGRDDPYSRLYRDSFRSYRQLAGRLQEETGIDIGWQPLGGIDLIFNDEDAAAAADTAAFNRARGCAVEELDHRQVRTLEPAISEAVRGGLHFPDDQRVDPARLAAALISVTENHGAAVHFGVRVLGFETVTERGVTLQTSAGGVEADYAVLAAGSWTGELGRMLGAQVPVRPVRGQHCRFVGVTVEHVVRYGGRHLLSADGLTVVGATVEEVGFDQETTPVAGREMAAFAGVVVTQPLSLREQRAGLRPKPKGGRPLIGPLEAFPRIFVATGHYKSGIQLGPGTGEVVARWIVDGDPGREMDRFKPER